MDFVIILQAGVATGTVLLFAALGEIFAERFPQKGDLLGETDLFHESIRPDPLEQFFFVHDSPTAFHQHKQRLEGFRGHRYELAFSQQNTLGGFKSERTKFINMFGLLVHKDS